MVDNHSHAPDPSGVAPAVRHWRLRARAALEAARPYLQLIQTGASLAWLALNFSRL